MLKRRPSLLRRDRGTGRDPSDGDVGGHHFSTANDGDRDNDSRGRHFGQPIQIVVLRDRLTVPRPNDIHRHDSRQLGRRPGFDMLDQGPVKVGKVELDCLRVADTRRADTEITAINDATIENLVKNKFGRGAGDGWICLRADPNARRAV